MGDLHERSVFTRLLRPKPGSATHTDLKQGLHAHSLGFHTHDPSGLRALRIALTQACTDSHSIHIIGSRGCLAPAVVFSSWIVLTFVACSLVLGGQSTVWKLRSGTHHAIVGITHTLL